MHFVRKRAYYASGAEKHQGLINERSTYGTARRRRRLPAKPETESDGADVLDAGVGHEPLDAGLADDEEGGDEQRERAEREQSAVRENRNPRSVGDSQIADDADHGGVEQGAGEQRRHRCGTFAVSVGQPGVHRRQSNLRSVADEHEEKGKRCEPGIEAFERPPQRSQSCHRWGRGRRFRSSKTGSIQAMRD